MHKINYMPTPAAGVDPPLQRG